MQINLTPTIKGVITGIVMLGTALGLYYSKLPPESPYHFLVYIIYALGITWTLTSYRQSAAYTAKFASLFGQGFRCFVVVTLVMVAFTGIFSRIHPEFAEEEAHAYKKYHMEQRGKTSKTPSQIDEEAAALKKQYTIRLVSEAIFGYLVIGSAVTAAVSGLLLIRRK